MLKKLIGFFTGTIFLVHTPLALASPSSSQYPLFVNQMVGAMNRHLSGLTQDSGVLFASENVFTKEQWGLLKGRLKAARSEGLRLKSEAFAFVILDSHGKTLAKISSSGNGKYLIESGSKEAVYTPGTDLAQNLSLLEKFFTSDSAKKNPKTTLQNLLWPEAHAGWGTVLGVTVAAAAIAAIWYMAKKVSKEVKKTGREVRKAARDVSEKAEGILDETHEIISENRRAINEAVDNLRETTEIIKNKVDDLAH